MVKNPPANAGDARESGLIPVSGRSPDEGNGASLQNSCLENSMGRGALAGYSSWGLKELDMTEHAHTLLCHFQLSYFEGGSNKTQL